MTNMNEYAVGGSADPPVRPLSEAENRRAVDLIEQAWRERPYCPCGAMTTAEAHGDVIWLECNTLSERREGLRGFLTRISSGVGHTRRSVVELSPSQALPAEGRPSKSEAPGHSPTRRATVPRQTSYDLTESGMVRFLVERRLTAATAPVWKDRAGISTVVANDRPGAARRLLADPGSQS